MEVQLKKQMIQLLIMGFHFKKLENLFLYYIEFTFMPHNWPHIKTKSPNSLFYSALGLRAAE